SRRVVRAALLPSAGRAQLNLPPDLDAGSGVEGAARTGADRAHSEAGPADRHALSGGIVDHELDPQRAVSLEIGRLGGIAQRVQIRLLRAYGGGGEARQLEDHPRTVL